ncbi:thiamine phosphate synthase [Konateibacter massiliensis]|uniref:thiamine phosphate synthase n=1 Tax=Konateibacter massiliensis TaxID=2002841 RepID=UPI000C1565BA|nr:thiamine phosphate synthase [Konateibacter massiliensis]
MKFDKKSLLLYAVTDSSWAKENTLEEQVEEALKAGVTFLQFREKEMSEDKMLLQAVRIKEIAKKYNIPFVINDNVEIALKCGADGVHVGQEDMSGFEARRLLGDDKIIGVSVQTPEQARMAENQGADYLGVGSVFNTLTKKDAQEVTLETLKEICESVTIPVIAIGGIQAENIVKLKDTGIQGIAVISAIFAEKDIAGATKELVKKVKDIVNE